MDINIDDYKLLNLSKDPFSIAPDPEFLYQSRQHFGTLELLECSIKKEKGMNVVLGPPGTGKTTLCRQLYRKISFEQNVSARVLSAHYYENSDRLIYEIAEAFGFVDLKKSEDIYDIFVHNYQGSGKTISLIIDNGHMIPEFCLSVLNRLNDLRSGGKNFFKIVIFANKEFSSNIEANPDFQSRIINYRILGPFNFRDTRQMILHRLKMAGSSLSAKQASKARRMFSYPAMFAIYLATGGYPRKIVILCHRCIVAMLLTKSIRAGWFLVRANARRVLESRKIIPESAVASAVIIGPLVAVALAIGVVNDQEFNRYLTAVNYIVENISINNRTVPDAVETVKESVEVIEDDTMIMPEVYFTDKKIEKTPEPPVEVEALKTVTSEAVEVKQSETVQEDVASLGVEQKDLKPLIPEMIGTVEVKRGDSLLVIMEKVYGHSRPKYKNPVVAANKHISNINSLEIGEKINFPTIVFEPSDEGGEKVWVKISSAETLDAAVNFIRNWSDRTLRLKLIPYYLDGSGLKFDIVVKKLYQTREEAVDFISKLPLSLTEKPEIIEFQLSRSVFFADPYAM